MSITDKISVPQHVIDSLEHKTFAQQAETNAFLMFKLASLEVEYRKSNKYTYFCLLVLAIAIIVHCVGTFL